MRLIATLAMLLPATAHAHGAEGVDPWSVAAGIAIAAAAAIYALALGKRASLPARSAVAFAIGITALVTALVSPLDRAAEDSFALHMIQHELLMIVAPPLLIVGRPFTAIAAVLPRAWVRMAAWPLRIPPIGAWALHGLALWVWHVPRLFDAGRQSDAMHALQHACFFFAAMLFWWTVFRRVRAGTAALYVLTTFIHMGAIAALITFAPAPLFAGTELEQQQLGGLIMWVPAGYALVMAGLLAFNRLLEPQP